MEDRNSSKEQGQQMNMVGINSFISIVTLNINGLNALIKRQRSSKWIIKQYPTIYCLWKMHFNYEGTYCIVKINEWKKIYQANTKEKGSVGYQKSL